MRGLLKLHVAPGHETCITCQHVQLPSSKDADLFQMYEHAVPVLQVPVCSPRLSLVVFALSACTVDRHAYLQTDPWYLQALHSCTRCCEVCPAKDHHSAWKTMPMILRLQDDDLGTCQLNERQPSVYAEGPASPARRSPSRCSCRGNSQALLMSWQAGGRLPAPGCLTGK